MALTDRIRLPALNLIHRRVRLLDLLESFIDNQQRLITVYAPGGYGKSILLADFAQTTYLPVCWCSLESTERDPTAFLTLLAYSIADRFHEIEPNKLQNTVERGDTDVSVRQIVNELANVGPHILVLDDYHKSVSASVTLTLNKLLDQLPDNSTMIVAARGDMAIETGKIIDLLIAERATGLSEVELAFNGEEIQRVMRKRFGRFIEKDQAERIAEATDGNIAQILLSGHVMHTENIIDGLLQRLGDDQDVIYDYLATEVFGKEREELQRFMLQTAILPEMTPEICNALLETIDAQAHIEELVRKDLFIAQIGAGFKYHDLFNEFLRIKLAEDPVLYYQVCIKAAYLLAERERYEDAVNLYLLVQAWDEAASLLETQGRFFYDTGRALTINSWLEQFPTEIISQYPRLLLLKGQILTNDLGEPSQAVEYIERAEARFREQEDRIGLAESQVYRSVSLRMMGQAKPALALATEGLNQLEALDASASIVAYAVRNCGIVHWRAGNIAESIQYLRRALAIYEETKELYQTGASHHDLGTCLERLGNISGAEYHYSAAIKIWETLGNANQLANSLNSLGVCYFLKRDFSSAMKHFEDSLNIAHQMNAARRAAFAQAGIGDVLLGQKAFASAVEAYQASTKLAQSVGVKPLEIYNLVQLGECYFQQGNLVQALQLASQAREIATEIGLDFEKGLASALQAKIYVRREEASHSFDLFKEASELLAKNDVMEQVKVRLWWGYSLLQDLRSSAALNQLQEAIRLSLTMGELIVGLEPTVSETQQLLLHFLHRSDTSAQLRNSIWTLMTQTQKELENSNPSLQIFMFGSPSLIVDGERKLFVQRGKVRVMPEFLAYLLIEGQNGGCRWGEISHAIWPDLPTKKSSINFHQSLRRLREVILNNPDHIIKQDDYYQLNETYLEWSDVLAFEKLYERTSALTPGRALPLQLELIALYQGEFLAGFELGEWGVAVRAEQEARFLQTVVLASEELLRQESPQEALNIIAKGLEQDPFREDLRRIALRAYAELGLYDQLASYYTELCAIIEREFDAPPDPETEELYETLMAARLV